MFLRMGLVSLHHECYYMLHVHDSSTRQSQQLCHSALAFLEFCCFSALYIGGLKFPMRFWMRSCGRHTLSGETKPTQQTAIEYSMLSLSMRVMIRGSSCMPHATQREDSSLKHVVNEQPLLKKGNERRGVLSLRLMLWLKFMRLICIKTFLILNFILKFQFLNFFFFFLCVHKII